MLGGMIGALISVGFVVLFSIVRSMVLKMGIASFPSEISRLKVFDWFL